MEADITIDTVDETTPVVDEPIVENETTPTPIEEAIPEIETTPSNTYNTIQIPHATFSTTDSF